MGLHQQFSLSDMATGGPFQSTAGSRLQKHQQHVPKQKYNSIINIILIKINVLRGFCYSDTLTY